jgi:hypothetical protein
MSKVPSGSGLARREARKTFAILGLAISLAAFVCGCGGVGAVTKLDHLRQVTKSCPDSPVAGLVALDARGSLRGRPLTVARLAAVESVATKVAVCGGGRLRVVVFGPSAAATVTVFDDELHPLGATENARLIRVPGVVSKAVGEVEQGLPAAFRQLTRNGADPVAQLAAARDFSDEVGAGGALFVLIETSGLTRMTARLTKATAVKLARQVSVPDLHVATVTFAGLGRVGAGPPPSTTTIDALRTYFETACRQTGARCRAVTDVAVGSGS